MPAISDLIAAGKWDGPVRTDLPGNPSKLVLTLRGMDLGICDGAVEWFAAAIRPLIDQPPLHVFEVVAVHLLEQESFG